MPSSSCPAPRDVEVMTVRVVGIAGHDGRMARGLESPGVRQREEMVLEPKEH
jgi:hypothetical protein